MEGNSRAILESKAFDDMNTETCVFSDEELRAITHRTVWVNDYTEPCENVDKKLLEYGRAVANEAIKRMANK